MIIAQKSKKRSIHSKVFGVTGFIHAFKDKIQTMKNASYSNNEK
jgi:hypothetical protein